MGGIHQVLGEARKLLWDKRKSSGVSGGGGVAGSEINGPFSDQGHLHSTVRKGTWGNINLEQCNNPGATMGSTFLCGGMLELLKVEEFI